MRKYLFIAYPVWLYVIFSVPTLLVSALFYSKFSDLLIINSAGALAMVLIHLCGKRKKMTQLPAMPWKRVFLTTGIMLVPVAALTASLTGKAFLNADLVTYLINCFWSFFWISCCEELLFREFLIFRMRKVNIPGWLTVLLPALLFSLCHRPESVSLLVQRFFLGALLGYLFLKRGDISLNVAVHWVFNIVIYTFQFTLQEVTALYSAPRAGLNVLLCLLSLLGIVVAYSINKSKFARYT
ncbi:MAG: CPBP family intramembrane glutamic endopeptidase [Bacteroidales bacterium]|jgi:membrane protease YdiL (CAAX protease family)|nr:CPBP family intramembrane metalloprotease [Bacteroidales bacterium]MDD2264203.1 CPBP family intramembrane metalloprotease [Bacteroidales bacterium]MDD2831325.1 CPBP family intramembrane metalloprotease [Bacteroidales bacterium]MDD3208320.1 CPBP family intramembrane metalloprotease [Bacteroidales bacterium]MDD3696997.1 CPBP family intramembrane metalloprotease [Bacteroidales bacterium]